jgi:hypothetical protein
VPQENGRRFAINHDIHPLVKRPVLILNDRPGNNSVRTTHTALLEHDFVLPSDHDCAFWMQRTLAKYNRARVTRQRDQPQASLKACRVTIKSYSSPIRRLADSLFADSPP